MVGIIYDLITGKNDKDTVEFAVVASCLKHTIEEDYNRRTIADVERLLHNRGSGRAER